MARVETISHPLRFPDMFPNKAQVMKVIAEIGTRADRGFQTGDGAISGQRLVDGIQSLDDAFEAGEFIFIGLAIKYIGLTRLPGTLRVIRRGGKWFLTRTLSRVR